MTKAEFIAAADARVRLVRAEYELTQVRMADALGLSKKTLVEIEKGRASLGWSGAVTLCTVFSGSEILAAALGGSASELIQALAFDQPPVRPVHTLGGRIWWRTLRRVNGWRIQQNLISHHYRILDPEDNRLCASFDRAVIEARFRAYAGL